MRKIDFDPAKLPPDKLTEWNEWQERTQKASAKVFDVWKSWDGKDVDDLDFKLDASIWGDLKKWLLKNVTYNKCAYCEKKLSTDPSETIYYDAEHYRPKGKVTLTGDTKAVEVLDEDGNKIKHPGYFWLAYDWKNLMPSCKVCNSGKGKMNQFSVGGEYVLVKLVPDKEKNKLCGNCLESPRKKSYFFLSTEELNLVEKPLLLNPYVDQGMDYLKFDDGGQIFPKENQKRGENTIRVLHLERQDLVDGRIKAQLFAENYVDDFHKARSYPNFAERRKQALVELKKLTVDGDGEFSVYVTCYISVYHLPMITMMASL